VTTATTHDYRRALDAALREYESLAARRGEVDARMAQLAQSIGSLSRLCGLVPTVPWGLTDACRMTLKGAGHPLTALEVRAQLGAMGFDLARYTSELAAIHTVLRRLTQSGEVEFVPRAWDKPAYQWRQPVVSVVISRAEAERLRGHPSGGPESSPAPTKAETDGPRTHQRRRR
jgi:hypothetical protein